MFLAQNTAAKSLTNWTGDAMFDYAKYAEQLRPRTPKSHSRLGLSAGRAGWGWLFGIQGQDLSFELIRRAWNTPCQSHSQKVVLAALACAADDKNECWPSIETLMRHCDLSDRGVQKQLRSLQSCGLIKIRDGGGKHQCNHYVLTLPNPERDSVNGIRRFPFAESGSPNPERRSPNPERCSPQQPGTAKEQPRGNGPRKTVNEIEKQIQRITEKMEWFRYENTDGSGKRWTSDSALKEYRGMKEQKARLESEMLSL